jgi:uncharacterized protein YndB with AHSA1/START domain
MAATARHSAVVTLPTETQIRITREFDAPPHLVYKAFTTPDLVRQWWHAKRGEVTDLQIDLRVGGYWRYAMIAHGEFEVAFHGEFREIVPNERLVRTEIYEAAPDAPALGTTTFAASGDGTLLTILVEHERQEHRDAHIQSGMEDGLQDALDLVDELSAGRQ